MSRDSTSSAIIEELSQPGYQQLLQFEGAVVRFSALRSEMVGLGTVIAMQPGEPSEDQRKRLQTVGAEHFMAGETVKALAMTLLANGLLSRCSVLIRTHGEGV